MKAWQLTIIRLPSLTKPTTKILTSTAGRVTSKASKDVDVVIRIRNWGGDLQIKIDWQASSHLTILTEVVTGKLWSTDSRETGMNTKQLASREIFSTILLLRTLIPCHLTFITFIHYLHPSSILSLQRMKFNMKTPISWAETACTQPRGPNLLDHQEDQGSIQAKMKRSP